MPTDQVLHPSAAGTPAERWGTAGQARPRADYGARGRGRLSLAPTPAYEKLAVVASALAVALLPVLIPSGPAHLAPVDGVIAIALSASILWAGWARVEVRAPYAFAVAVFVAAGAVAALVGPVPGKAVPALAQDLWLLAWALCIANVFRTPHALKIVLRVWVCASAVWAALALIGELTNSALLAGYQANEGGRITLTLGDPSYAANYFFLSIMIIAATRWPRHRLARVLLYALLLTAWALTGSNSGIIQMFVGIATGVMVAVYRRLGLTALLAAGCCFLIVGITLIPRIPIERVQASARASQHRMLRDWVGRSQKTTAQRELLTRESIELYYQGGPLGQGPTSTVTRLSASQAPFAREAHDDYLAALVERGFFGAIGLLILIGSVGIRGLTIVRRPLAPAFAKVVPAAGFLLGAVAGTLVMAAVYEVLHVRHVWALFGLVAAIFLWGRE